MKITLTAWNSAKKADSVGKDGKKAPDTGLTGAIKSLESAYQKMNSQPTTSTCDTTSAALKKIDDLLTKWIPKLQANWPNLTIALKTMQKNVGVVESEIETHKKNLEIDTKVAKAGSPAEAIYEGLWGTFEKTRIELTNAPSRAGFAKAQRELDALIKQAGVVGDSDIYLKPKYNKQEKVLTGIKNTIAQSEVAYEKAISDCIDFRKKAKQTLDGIYTALVQAKGQFTKIKGLAEQAHQGGNTEELAKHKKLAGMLLKSALAKCKEGEDFMAVGTPLKSGTDWRNAKIHKNEAISLEPFTTAAFESNKANLQTKKEITDMAGEIVKLV